MGIKKSIRNILENIIAQYLPWIVGVAVIILTWLRQLPLYQILLIALGILAAIFLAMNQYDLWKERHKKKLTQLSDKELESEIREWVNITAWSVQPQPLGDDISFAYRINHQNLHVFIFRHVKEPLVIALSSKLAMHSKKLCYQRLSGKG